MENKKQTILFIGCGNMGKAILSSLAKNCSNINYAVIDRNYSTSHKNITTYGSIEDLNCTPDVIFLAIKPQILPQLKNDLIKITNGNTLIISILAGTNTKQIEDIVGKNSKIIRLMPNIAAISANSTSSCFFNKNINQADRNFATSLFKSFGICEILSDEYDMHISTLINGGAIAYFALIIKYLKQAALKNAKSLTESQINSLIYNTYENLLELNKTEDDVISLICSKKGTTESVIESLNNQNLENIIANAIEKGMERSKELEKNTK
ncbi:MAG: NAD(P)-binding domain-containing protein [Rickettsiales bacterium]|nr:NAD(P)-binding domain-containing protein [Rickettsiales bacterium]